MLNINGRNINLKNLHKAEIVDKCLIKRAQLIK